MNSLVIMKIIIVYGLIVQRVEAYQGGNAVAPAYFTNAIGALTTTVDNLNTNYNTLSNNFNTLNTAVTEGFDQLREQRRVDMRNAQLRRKNLQTSEVVFKVLCEQDGNPNFGLEPPDDLLPPTRGGLTELNGDRFDQLEEFYGETFDGPNVIARYTSLQSFLGIIP